VTHFKGTIIGADGGLMHLNIFGPKHFHFDKSYVQSFDEPINLSEGSYTISMSVATQGKFTFDVSGGYKSIDPGVPDRFNKSMHMYDLKV
jgi:hypothetical protein